jgi:hypothetical protein
MSYAQFQQIEACLWIALAAILVVTRGRKLVILAIALILFGGSDLVEAHTGAWWRPWWLLVWKGACVLAIILVIASARYRARS